jgi:16S rRNA G966 N2-methylase RsmD
MVFQILFAGNGVTVIEHLCRVKGKKVFIATAPPTCCKIKKEVHTSNLLQISKTKCCVEHSTFVKVNTSASKGSSFDFQKSYHDFLNETIIHCFSIKWIEKILCNSAHQFYSPPYSLAGRKLLILIQIFLI